MKPNTARKEGPKVAIVTGVSCGGLGEALALNLDGKRDAQNAMVYRVFATGRSLKGVAHLCDEHAIEVQELDVTDRASVALSMGHIQKRAGSIDLCICNAGISAYGPLVEQSEEELKQVLDTNVLGTIRVLQEVVPIMMLQRSGHIVIIGSADADLVTPWAAASSAAQAALRALTQALRQEVGRFGVAVTQATVGPFTSPHGLKALQRAPLKRYTVESCPFHDAVDGMERRVFAGNNDEKAMTAEEAAEGIVRELQRRKPRRHFYVGKRAKQLSRLGFVQQWLWPWLVERGFAGEYSTRVLAHTRYAQLASAPPIPYERLEGQALRSA